MHACMQTLSLSPPPPPPQLRVELAAAQNSAATAVDSEKLRDLQAEVDSKTTKISSLNKTVQSLKQV